ncbi:proliferation-associated protein 1 [Clavulina sp. PMI_390]|nr:proliferation-associated protein 1 [Clavulina sp. PMI_390]
MSTETAPAPAPAPVAPTGISNDDLTKYKTAGEIVNGALKKLIELCVEGAKVYDLCVEGDKLVEAATGAVYNKAVKGVKVAKGLAFPTCISVNNVVSHFSPLPSDDLVGLVLAKDDVVKLHVGAQIDGFASVSAETMVVGASAQNPVTGPRADAIKAAYTASEIAARLIKAGEKNWAVTDAISKVALDFGTKPIEGMLSCEQSKNVIDGKKRIIQAPTEGSRSGVDSATFADGDVWGMDILIASGTDGKAKQAPNTRTSVYQKANEVTYQLKMKTSRAVFSEIQKKAGAFPFNIRNLEDEKRSRVGVQEAEQHGLIKPYEVQATPAGSFVAAFHFTLALLPAGPSLISHAPIWYSEDKVKSDKELKDPELRELLTKPLREPKKKNKKKEGEAEK